MKTGFLSCGLVAMLITLSACSPYIYSGDSSSDVQIDVRNTGSSKMDISTEKYSEALHHYLVGQLNYVNEDFPKAIQHFSKANDLLAEPEPTLSVKLAELYVRSGELDKALAESGRALAAQPNNTHLLLLRAGVLESAGRPAEAAPIYEQIISAEPFLFDTYVLLATLYAREGRVNDGIQILQQLAKQAPKEPVAYHYMGRLYETKGDLSAAEQSFRKADKLGPTDTSIKLDLLRVLIKRKKLSEAKPLCEKILVEDSGNVVARKVMSFLLVGENKLEEALEHLEALDGQETNSADTRYNIALIQIERRNFKAAARELNFVLAARPDFGAARYYLASIYAGAGRKREAVDELLKIGPDQELYVKARTFAAFILKQEGDFNGAEKAIRDAWKAEPDNEGIFSYLILVLRDAKKFPEAESLLKEELKRRPQDDKLLFNYALLMDEQKRPAEAVKWMETVIEVNPDHADALNYVAYSIAESGRDLDRAQKLIERALALKPNDGYYLDTLGWIYYQRADYSSAAEILKRAVGLTGNDPDILEHYGDVLFKLNNYAEAHHVYLNLLEKIRDQSDTLGTEVIERVESKIAAVLRIAPELQELSLKSIAQ